MFVFFQYNPFNQSIDWFWVIKRGLPSVPSVFTLYLYIWWWWHSSSSKHSSISTSSFFQCTNLLKLHLQIHQHHYCKIYSIVRVHVLQGMGNRDLQFQLTWDLKCLWCDPICFMSSKSGGSPSTSGHITSCNVMSHHFTSWLVHVMVGSCNVMSCHGWFTSHHVVSHHG